MSEILTEVRTYTIGKDDRGRETITLNQPLRNVPFGVWRDVARLAGQSSETAHTVTFYFLGTGIEQAKQILAGALWEERPGDYEACGYCGFDHDYEHAEATKWHNANPGKGYDNA